MNNEIQNQEDLILEETIEEEQPVEIPPERRRVYADKKVIEVFMNYLGNFSVVI